MEPHIGYLALRGELADALLRYERLVPEVPPRRVIGWMTVRAQYTETLLLGGQYERARAVDAIASVPHDASDVTSLMD